jgi:LPXTG-site transpeptidase (sortase) family protein
MIRNSLQHVRYYTAIILLYGTTVLGGLVLVHPTFLNTLGHDHVLALGDSRDIPYTQVPANSLSTPKRIGTSGRPIRISIPSLNIDLPVDEGLHDPTSGSWTLSDTRAQYAVPSRPANDQGGMTLIYGHNNRHVFAPLHRLRSNDIAQVRTHNGYVFHYRYLRYDMVTPENVSIFAYEGKPQLTLQTCSGNWDGLRRLHHFSLLRVEKLS